MSLRQWILRVTHRLALYLSYHVRLPWILCCELVARECPGLQLLKLDLLYIIWRRHTVRSDHLEDRRSFVSVVKWFASNL